MSRMVAPLLWWLVVQLFSLAVLPLAWRLFGWLPGRGYALSKALGLLLVSYVLWLGAAFHLLPNSPGGILVSLLIVAALSAWLGREGLVRDPAAGRERPIVGWLRANRRLVVASELLLLAVFLGWTAFRAYNPDIAGTEKPMEFAFINGVLRSRLFPPQDPWLSGYAISYYYFGYVILGILIRLTGVDPAVGFNLGVALWCALAALGGFGIVYDLVGLAAGRGERGEASALASGGAGEGAAGAETGTPDGARQAGQGKQGAQRRGIRYGLLGALFVAFLGNLEGLVEIAYNRSLVPLRWIEWLDIKQLMDAPPSGDWTGGFWWWWRASRVIHDRDLLGNSVEVIDEFPFFSFLLGDMHPHVLALPFVFLAIGLALNLLLAARRYPAPGQPFSLKTWRDLGTGLRRLWRFLENLTGLGTPGVFLYAIAFGALAFLNTWDFPIYVALATIAAGAGLAWRRSLTWAVAGRAAAAGLALGVLGWLCYLPFYLGFQSQLGGILPNLLFPTRLSQFLLMFGPFLLVAVFFLALLSRRGAPHPRRSVLVFLWVVLAPLALWGLVALAVAALPQGRAFVQSLLDNPAVQVNIGDRTLPQLIGLAARLRLATPWTFLFLAALLAWVIVLIWVRLPAHGRAAGEPGSSQVGPEPAEDAGGRQAADLFVLLLMGLAALLTLSVEFVYLRDLFGTRMNTVFKFYYQAWVLLGLAAAYGLSRLAERGTPAPLKWPALVLAGLLTIGGLTYTVAAIPSKADSFQGRPTLDGLAYLRRSNPADMAAIAWIRANVPPQAVVLEASGGSYSPEGAGRVSMATGNPTLLGWDFHEMQWRGKAYERLAAGRPDAVAGIYRGARPDELPGLLERWGVDYVYVGALERSKYGIGDAALARFDRFLTRVYDADGVVIFGR